MRGFFSKIHTTLPSVFTAIVVIIVVFLTAAVLPVYASTYGEGAYGSGVYSPSATPIPPTLPPSTAPGCGDIPPGPKAPWLYGAIAQDSTSIRLYFTEAANPVDKYVLEFGTRAGDYQYGVQDMGVNSRSQMTFLVQSLSPNTTYYFRVRAGNGCATGPWSNEISAKTQARFSFFTQTDDLETEIVDTGVTKKEEEPKVLGVDVRIKVVDEETKPVGGAQVTLYSTPRKAVTGEKGVAHFENVEPGEHRLVIAYNGQAGEQKITVQGDSDIKEVDFTIQIRSTSPFKEPLVRLVVGGLSLALLGAFVVIFKR